MKIFFLLIKTMMVSEDIENYYKLKWKNTFQIAALLNYLSKKKKMFAQAIWFAHVSSCKLIISEKNKPSLAWLIHLQNPLQLFVKLFF